MERPDFYQAVGDDTMKNPQGIVKGDHVNFRTGDAFAAPANKRRKVRGLDRDGRVLVHFAGFQDYIVRDSEITSITKGGEVMKYSYNLGLTPDGHLPPSMWVETDAKTESEALQLACNQLKLEQLPFTVHIASDKFLYPEGTPMMTKAFTMEVAK